MSPTFTRYQLENAAYFTALRLRGGATSRGAASRGAATQPSPRHPLQLQYPEVVSGLGGSGPVLGSDVTAGRPSLQLPFLRTRLGLRLAPAATNSVQFQLGQSRDDLGPIKGRSRISLPNTFKSTCSPGHALVACPAYWLRVAYSFIIEPTSDRSAILRAVPGQQDAMYTGFTGRGAVRVRPHP